MIVDVFGTVFCVLVPRVDAQLCHDYDNHSVPQDLAGGLKSMRQNIVRAHKFAPTNNASQSSVITMSDDDDFMNESGSEHSYGFV